MNRMIINMRVVVALMNSLIVITLLRLNAMTITYDIDVITLLYFILITLLSMLTSIFSIWTFYMPSLYRSYQLVI